MHPEKPDNQTKPEPLPEIATDIEMASFLVGHIDNPCEVEVAPGQIENIRGVYIREAKRLLPTMTNPEARDLLHKKIQQFEGK